MIRDSRGGYNRKPVNEDFFKIWTPQMAYVLGYLLADGAIEDVRKSSRTCYIQLTSIDKGLLEQVQQVMGSKHKLYLVKAHVGSIRGKKFNSQDSHVLRIGNKAMFQDLANMGLVPKKADRIRVPEMEGKFFRYFLRGYFDGDGCVNIYKSKNRNKYRVSVIYTSCSYGFLNSILNHLENSLGLINRSPYFQYGAFRLMYRGKKALKVLGYMYQDLDGSPYLERKYKIYNNFLQNN